MKGLFISDFDGTATALDFYKIILNDIGEEGWAYVTSHRKTGKVDYHFLNRIFAWQLYSDVRYQSLINEVKLDPYLKPFLELLDKSSIDFKFVSAGFDRYIHDVLDHYGLSGLNVLTNPGSFKEGLLKIEPMVDSPFYSPLFGIDKGAVVKSLRRDYDRIYFAGDSEPDLPAALEADVIFAKGELIPLVHQAQRTCIPFESFNDILDYFHRNATEYQ